MKFEAQKLHLTVKTLHRFVVYNKQERLSITLLVIILALLKGPDKRTLQLFKRQVVLTIQ